MRQTQRRSDRADRFTYGIEIECYLPRGTTNIGGYHRGIQVTGLPTGWIATSDGSLTGGCPAGHTACEIISPILKGQDGINQIKIVTDWLNRVNARVNTKCGFHVHVGVKNEYTDSKGLVNWVRNVILQTAQNEKMLYAVTGTHSREHNSYCSSIRRGILQNGDERALQTYTGNSYNGILGRTIQRINNTRYKVLNLKNINLSGRECPRNTVEFRVFSGTTSYIKIIGYIQIAIALCEKALDNKTTFNAPSITYYTGSEGLKGLNRFFSLNGWTLGRKDVKHNTVSMNGWVADTDAVNEVKKELRRLVKKYDGAAR